jgi:hypothetical protein
LPNGFWQDELLLRHHFDEVGKLLGKTKESWERTSTYSLLRFKISSVVQTFGSLQKALQIAYPTVQWSFPSSSIGQQYLKRLVERIFCSTKTNTEDPVIILENYKHPDLLFPVSKRKAELDIYIPSLKLALEYQGAQHERQIYRGDVRRQTERDKEKKELCKQHGITLICIPYKWSGLTEDLIATVQQYRPEIQFANCFPLGLGTGTPVLAVSQTSSKPKKVGSLVAFMLPKVYRHVLDPTSW